MLLEIYKSLGVIFFFTLVLLSVVWFVLICFIIAFFTFIKIVISQTLSIWLYKYSIFPWNLNKFKMYHWIHSADVYLYPDSLRKLVDAISLRFAQTDTIRRLNFVQLPKIIFCKTFGDWLIDWIGFLQQWQYFSHLTAEKVGWFQVKAHKFNTYNKPKKLNFTIILS